MTFNLHPTRTGPPQTDPARTGTALQRPLQRFPRVLFSVPLTLRHLADGGIRASLGVSLDISEGGLGAIVRDGLRVGEMVEIDVQIPNHALSAVAIVRYATSVRSGFEFVGLSTEERHQIAKATAHA